MSHGAAAVMLTIAIGIGVASGVIICLAARTRPGQPALVAWPVSAVAVFVGILIYADWAPPANPGGHDYTGLIGAVLAGLTFISTGIVLLGFAVIKHLQRTGERRPLSDGRR